MTGGTMDDETTKVLYEIFEAGFVLGAQVKDHDLAKSEIKQRCQHRFISLLHELRER